MRGRLDAPVLVGVGAAFDFHAGVKRQAPTASSGSASSGRSASPRSRAGCGGATLHYNPRFVTGVRSPIRPPPAGPPLASFTREGQAEHPGACWRSRRRARWRPLQPQVVDDDPAVAAQGAGDMRVFIRGRDNALWTRTWNGSSGRAGPRSAARSTSGPAAMARPGGIYAVFVRGPGNAYVAPRLLPVGRLVGLDVARRRLHLRPGHELPHGAGEVDVFGTDGQQLFHRSWIGAWSRWTPLGCGVTAAPSVSSPDPDILDVWVRGTDNQLHQKSWTPSTSWAAFNRARRGPDLDAGGDRLGG